MPSQMVGGTTETKKEAKKEAKEKQKRRAKDKGRQKRDFPGDGYGRLWKSPGKPMGNRKGIEKESKGFTSALPESLENPPTEQGKRKGVEAGLPHNHTHCC